ncbi:ChbG/HpnK family deacetylase [Thermoflavifilum thermophilum]|nr:ChbG/HpnK family deacetylase [Thermoflavifilum thermophilum]
MYTKLFVSAQTKQSVYLLVRGDDMGITHTSNLACMEAYEKGWMKSVEVIVPAPWFPEAARMLRMHPDLDVGVHLALTSEWDNIKWRPLTCATSLTDSAGYFFPVIWPNKYYDSSRALITHSWKIGEIVRELDRQITVAQQAIPQLSHVSYHMGCNEMNPAVQHVIDSLANLHGLYVDMSAVQPVNYAGPHRSTSEKIHSFIRMIQQLQPGIYLFVDHPSFDDGEMQAVYMKGYANVAEDRQGVTDLFTNPQVKNTMDKLNIHLIDYKWLKTHGQSKKEE